MTWDPENKGSKGGEGWEDSQDDSKDTNIIIIGEVSQMEKDKNHVISTHMWDIKQKATNEQTKSH